ncbi:PAS-domain containing protein [Mesobacterium pallidum]|uniref:hybrid sensor histidine kinase/response regulator n=1 Tax=Mesobacterium pallidum TaxID=2872037 RepID=UPI001EE1D337|nr:PAS-domain containing protein [Mesobacterium pallidum]
MSLIDPTDSLERQNEKLVRIAESLMRRVEQSPNNSGLAYAQFERAALLEAQVRQRTNDLERTLDLLHSSNARLAQANAEAEAARKNLAEAIEAVDEGFALFDVDDRLVMHNTRFCKELADIKPILRPGLSFEDYVQAVSGSRFLSLPGGDTPGSWADRRMARHKDRHVVFNVALIWDRWLQVSEHRSASGGTAILQTDVTKILRLERRERDRLVDRQARMVRATLDHLNQGVCIFDKDQRLVGWNMQMEALLQLPAEGSVLGLPFSDLLDRLDDTLRFTGQVGRDDIEAWARLANGRRPLNFEIQRLEDQIFAVFAQEMPDRGFVISFTDVTVEREAARALRDLNETLERRVEERTLELGEALAEAQRANASKNRFVAAASHDLLQPLSAAKLFMASLEERCEGEAGETATKAISALASVEGIIEALLDISKLDSGQASLNIQPVHLGALVSSLRTEMMPLARGKGLELRIVPSSLLIESDPIYLRRVIQNLVTNAIRHTNGRKIVLGVRRTGGAARVEVWDEGPGIAPEDQQVIFQEFRQLQPGRSGANGLGLGLAIVERACQTLGHRLGLWSEPGRGSCFSVSATCIGQGVATDARRPEGRKMPLAEGLVVFLVENDPDVARGITLTIEGWGSHVIHTESGEEALSLMEELGILPDGFLIDNQLGAGNMPGTELLGHLRARYGDINARIISADRTQALMAECDLLGVPFIAKPLDRARLVEFMESARQDFAGA